MDLAILCLQKSEERAVLKKRLSAEEQERIDYGGYIKEYRLSSAVTAKKMSEDIGISSKRLRRLEEGRRVRDEKLIRGACERYLELENVRQAYRKLEKENKELRRAHENILVQFGGRSWSLAVDVRRRII